MIIKGEMSLLQLKKMALSYLLYLQEKQIEHRRATNTKSNLIENQMTETEGFITEIDNELKQLIQ